MGTLLFSLCFFLIIYSCLLNAAIDPALLVAYEWVAGILSCVTIIYDAFHLFFFLGSLRESTKNHFTMLDKRWKNTRKQPIPKNIEA